MRNQYYYYFDLPKIGSVGPAHQKNKLSSPYSKKSLLVNFFINSIAHQFNRFMILRNL